jgi:hypothetical protein
MTAPRVTHPALYRVYQFFAALKATLPPWAGGVWGGLTTEDETLVTSALKTPGQQQLFARMAPHDQRHALAVVCTLQAAGYHQTTLMQAALLHDVGKSMGQPLLHRVLIVLFEAFWPTGLAWLSGKSASQSRQNGTKYAIGNTSETSQFSFHPSIQKVGWWRRPFVIHAQHPMIGATWAEEAACEPLVVRLIARHQEVLGAKPISEEEKLLAALQWADNLN